MENREEKSISKWHKLFKTIIVSFIALFTTGISLFVVSIGSLRDAALFASLSASMTGMLFASVLLIYCCLIFENSPKGKMMFISSFLLYISIIVSGTVDYFTGLPHFGNLIFALQNLLSVLVVIIQISLWFYESASLPENRYKKYFTIWFFILSLVYLSAILFNRFTGFLYSYDDFGTLTYDGALFDFLFFFLAYSSYLVYVLLQKCGLRKKLSLASITVLPFSSILLMVVNGFFNVYYNGSSSLIIALILAEYAVFFGDFLEDRRLLLSQKAELAEASRKQMELDSALMLSQIKPHFLYNAITAIRNLCKTNPKEAYTSLGLFADYLRENMDTLENGRMIPFEKELEHTKTYLLLEQMRFGEELEIVYDIEYTDFRIPALTVQPMVENAVRHGATLNENGGKIVISSRKTEEGAWITIKDNGPGFNPEEKTSDGRNHFGISNVRNLLSLTDCGRLFIESVPGEGTTVTIKMKGASVDEYPASR